MRAGEIGDEGAERRLGGEGPVAHIGPGRIGRGIAALRRVPQFGGVARMQRLELDMAAAQLDARGQGAGGGVDGGADGEIVHRMTLNLRRGGGKSNFHISDRTIRITGSRV